MFGFGRRRREREAAQAAAHEAAVAEAEARRKAVLEARIAREEKEAAERNERYARELAAKQEEQRRVQQRRQAALDAHDRLRASLIPEDFSSDWMIYASPFLTSDEREHMELDRIERRNASLTEVLGNLVAQRRHRQSLLVPGAVVTEQVVASSRKLVLTFSAPAATISPLGMKALSLAFFMRSDEYNYTNLRLGAISSGKYTAMISYHDRREKFSPTMDAQWDEQELRAYLEAFPKVTLIQAVANGVREARTSLYKRPAERAIEEASVEAGKEMARIDGLKNDVLFVARPKS